MNLAVHSSGTLPEPTPPRLYAEGLTKRFGATLAVESVGFVLEAGEKRAIVGENGAGKSTVMRIVSGSVSADDGRLEIDGKPYAPREPMDARSRGVVMVHQELALAGHMRVYENVFLGLERIVASPPRGASLKSGLSRSLGLLDHRRMRRECERVLALLGREDLDPDATVSNLPIAGQQVVEIARALAQNARLVILDEPTSSLARPDVDRLFDVLNELSEQGIGLLYVSHFLEEVEAIADTVTVLRDGRTCFDAPMSRTNAGELVEHMIGQPAERLFVRSPSRHASEPLLEVRRLSATPAPDDASLTISRGEVLGIAGLVGAGRSELLRTLFGLQPIRDGRIRFGVFEGHYPPRDRLRQGMGLLSEDRQREGLALDLDLSQNLVLPRLESLGPGPVVLPWRADAVAEEWLTRLDVQAETVATRARRLSGGNQQKLALARLLYQDLDLLLLDEPTRGIDIGAKSAVYRLIDRLATENRAVIVVSSYFPELIGVCDRIAVMRRGVLGEARPTQEWDEHRLLLEASVGTGPDADGKAQPEEIAP